MQFVKPDLEFNGWRDLLYSVCLSLPTKPLAIYMSITVFLGFSSVLCIYKLGTIEVKFFKSFKIEYFVKV